MRFVVIGAGMAGILATIRLREAGYEDVVVYEKADRVGGTWRENTYPGLACDVPSHLYSYSFATNPDWSRRYSPGAEIQAYFTDVATRHGVTERIRFGKEIVRCAFEDGRWRLTANDGTTDVADVVIAATGVLHHPKMPDFPGLETFAGGAFHSARWDHSVPIDGRRVGVVGTGSSAIQIVTAIVDRVSELVLFQRTPQWIMPSQHPTASTRRSSVRRRGARRRRRRCGAPAARAGTSTRPACRPRGHSRSTVSARRWEGTGPGELVHYCHCAMCRKTHGTAFATAAGLPADGFRFLSGEAGIRRYESSPGNQRCFCGRCGASVPGAAFDGTVFVPFGNVADDPGGRPVAHIYVASQAPWFVIADELPQFPEFLT